MQKFEYEPTSIGDVLVDTASDLFSRTELKGVTLPKDVFVGDILSKATFELFKAGDADQSSACLTVPPVQKRQSELWIAT